MKKNDKKLMENFQESYFMYIDEFEGVSEDKAIEAEPGDYFGEYHFGFGLCVPVPKGEEYTQVYKLKLSYDFQFYYTDDNKYDVTFNDFNRPRINVYSTYADNIMEAVGTNDVYFCEFNEDTFSNFAIDKSAKELDKCFKGMNEQFFFDFKVKKNEVNLSQSLLNQLQKNFYSDLVNFLEKLEQKDYQSLIERHELKKQDLEGLSNAIQHAERMYYYNKLKDELPLNTQEKSTKMPKPKI